MKFPVLRATSSCTSPPDAIAARISVSVGSDERSHEPAAESHQHLVARHLDVERLVGELAATVDGASLHLFVELRRQVDGLVGPHDSFAIDDDVDAFGLRQRLDLRARLLQEVLDELRALTSEVALELDVDLLQLDELLLELLALLRVDLGL